LSDKQTYDCGFLKKSSRRWNGQRGRALWLLAIADAEDQRFRRGGDAREQQFVKPQKNK